MEDNPFVNLKIDPQDFLDVMDGRTMCPKCGRSRKYYCYTCYVPVQGIEHKIPKVKLPFKIDIIKHPSECDGKSTSVHARVIAPDDVTIYTYPCIPDYPDRDRVVLLFPGDGSINMETLAEKFPPHVNINSQQNTSREDRGSDTSEEKTEAPCLVKFKGDDPYNGAHKEGSSSPERKPATEDKLDQTSASSFSEDSDNIFQTNTEIPHQKDVNHLSRKRKHSLDGEEVKRSKLISEVKPPFDRVIIIDSTWNQTKRISSDERLKGLTCVELKTRHSNFWRHQKDIPPTYLSTVEAIYYFVRDFHDVFVTSGDTEYDGRYDNLLFLFTYMYNKIKKMYNGGRKLKAYQQREDKIKSENKV